MKKQTKLLNVRREREAAVRDGKRIVVGWIVTGERTHHVWRSVPKPASYRCDCEAGTWRAPCKHIAAVLRFEFRSAVPRLYASVAKREDEARAHHRRMIRVSANERPVWVTFRRA